MYIYEQNVKGVKEYTYIYMYIYENKDRKVLGNIRTKERKPLNPEIKENVGESRST